MPRAAKREDQPWLRYLVLPFALILFGLLVSYTLLVQNRRPAPLSPPIIITPTPTPTPPK